MFRQLLKIRYLAAVIVVLSVLHAVAFLVMGARIAFEAYWHVLDETTAAEARPGIELLHSLDFLFVSLVLLVLGLGIAKLRGQPDGGGDRGAPGLAAARQHHPAQGAALGDDPDHPDDRGALRSDWGLFTTLSWTALTIPAAILLLALSLFFMKKA